MKALSFGPTPISPYRLILCGVMLICLPGLAGGTPVVSQEEQGEIVGKISSLLERNYVFPEVGKRVSEELLAKHEQEGYAVLTSAKDFAEQLNTDLMEWSSDKHLGVIYDPDWVRQIRAQDPEQDAYLTKEMLDEDRKKNFGFKRVEILDGNIGYLDLRIFFHPKHAGETAVAAMKYLSNCDAMIVDLRHNGGGWGTMVAFLCSYFFEDEDIVHLMSAYWRPEDMHYQSWTAPYVPGKVMPDIPLYILTSKSTFSAAEEFCYDLKQLNRAVIVGENTRGGAHPIDPKVLNDNFILILPEWTSIHPITKANWEGVGVEPDIKVSADEAFNVAYREILKRLSTSTTSDKEKAYYQWHIDGLCAKIDPIEVDTLILQSYVGKYGSVNISHEKGTLCYQRGDRAVLKTVPMAEDLFLIDEMSDIRLRFKKEGVKVIGLVALYSDGRKVEYIREND